MQPAKTLIRIKHGSHLYGTSTPSSDTDIKGVHLPAGRDIIMMRPDHVIDQGIKLSDGLKNSSIDTDDQSYSLAKFLGMLVNGDTVASEILFAPQESIIEMDPLWPQVRAEALKAINRKCEGYVSYCNRQAAKYGIKGSRMGTVEALIALFDSALELTPSLADARLLTMQRDLEDFCESHDNAEIIPILVKGIDVPHLSVVDRKFPFTVQIKNAYKVYKSVYDNYGQRALAAKTNDGIDWKAVSHAIRVAGQAIELLTTGTIGFPRPNADHLLAIKKGVIPFALVQAEIEDHVLRLERAAASSDLPEETDQQVIDDIVFAFHRLQVV